MSTPSIPKAEPKSPAGDTLDLHALWRTVLRRRWLVIPFFLATVLVTTIVTLRQTKIYDATTTIVIDLTGPRVFDKDQVQDVMDVGSGGYWYSREYYETQYKILASRAVAERAATELGLGADVNFLGLDQIGDAKQREARRQAADPVKVLQRNLKIEPVKDSRIVRIRYEDSDPDRAARIANAVADAYVKESLSVRSTATQSASSFLEDQLHDLEKKLDESGQALFEFKKSHDIVSTSWEDRQSMVSQRLTSINDALTRARVRKAELQARNEAMGSSATALVQGDPARDASGAAALNTTIDALKLRYLEARSECADLRVKYLDDHPKIAACDEKLRIAKQGLDTEVESTLDAARREYDEVARSERNLSTLLEQTKADAFGLNQYEREYLELKRTYDNNQRLYELVLKRLKDTGVTGTIQASNVRVLDAARASRRPIRPDPGRNAALAILLGLLGGVMLAFGAEYLDTSINGQEQIEEKLGLAFLGIVPSIPPNKDGTPQDLIVHSQPKSAVAECLRAIRTNLLFMSPEKPLRTILVTSSGPQEGKTTTATSLAVTMTASGNRVLIVDADMRRPRLHRIFGITNDAGLSSLILGEGRLQDLVRPSGIPNLFVLPCGPVPPNPAELLHTESFRRLLAEMGAQFDRVILDSPPVGVVADAVVISTQVDGALMVLKAGRTSRDVGRQAVKQLRDVNAPLFGAVLNDLDLEDQKYGQYSYYYRYGYYYGDSSRKQSPGEGDEAKVA
jgi:capsular exopolysaccharide synthesis family protein